MTQKLSMFLALAAATMLITACDDDSDSGNSSTTNCTNDAVQCSDAGVPQKCVNGAWVDQSACATGQTCSNGACSASGTPQQPGASCQGNQKKCDEKGVPMVCNSGVWTAQAACAAGKTCKDGACVDGSGDADKCENDKKKCDESGVPMLCVNNVWTAQTACAAGKTCKDGACVDGGGDADKCENKKKKCDESGVPMLCVNNVWTAQTACKSEEICKDGECKKPACKEDEKGCDENGIPRICLDGEWEILPACAVGKSCKAGDCVKGSTDTKCAKGTTALNGLCVNDAMNAAKDGDECDKSWINAEFCDANQKAVYCDMEQKYWDDLEKFEEGKSKTLPDPSNYKIVVYKTKCDNGCTNADISSYMEATYYSATCKDDINTKCTKEKDILTVCDEYEEDDYAETTVYACYPAADGGLIGVRVTEYYSEEDIYELDTVPGECFSGFCNEDLTACEPYCTKDSECKEAGEGYDYCSLELDMCVECKEDKHCASSKKGKYCYVEFGECAECLEDKHCGSGKSCKYGTCQ